MDKKTFQSFIRETFKNFVNEEEGTFEPIPRNIEELSRMIDRLPDNAIISFFYGDNKEYISSLVHHKSQRLLDIGNRDNPKWRQIFGNDLRRFLMALIMKNDQRKIVSMRHYGDEKEFSAENIKENIPPGHTQFGDTPSTVRDMWNLMARLPYGHKIVFSGRSHQRWASISKIVYGDEWSYYVEGSELERRELERTNDEEEENEFIAYILDNHLWFPKYTISKVEGAKTKHDLDLSDPDHDIGHYEKYGPDPLNPDDYYPPEKDDDDKGNIPPHGLNEAESPKTRLTSGLEDREVMHTLREANDGIKVHIYQGTRKKISITKVGKEQFIFIDYRSGQRGDVDEGTLGQILTVFFLMFKGIYDFTTEEPSQNPSLNESLTPKKKITFDPNSPETTIKGLVDLISSKLSPGQAIIFTHKFYQFYPLVFIQKLDHNKYKIAHSIGGTYKHFSPNTDNDENDIKTTFEHLLGYLAYSAWEDIEFTISTPDSSNPDNDSLDRTQIHEVTGKIPFHKESRNRTILRIIHIVTKFNENTTVTFKHPDFDGAVLIKKLNREESRQANGKDYLAAIQHKNMIVYQDLVTPNDLFNMFVHLDKTYLPFSEWREMKMTVDVTGDIQGHISFAAENIKRTDILKEHKHIYTGKTMIKEQFHTMVKRILNEVVEEKKKDNKVTTPVPEEHDSDPKLFPHEHDTMSKEQLVNDLKKVVHAIDEDFMVFWTDHDDIMVRARDLFQVRIIPYWENNYKIEALIRNEDLIRVLGLDWEQVKKFIKDNFSQMKATYTDVARERSFKNMEDQVPKPDAGLNQKDKPKKKEVGDTKNKEKNYKEDQVKKEDDLPNKPMKEVGDFKWQSDHKVQQPVKSRKHRDNKKHVVNMTGS